MAPAPADFYLDPGELLYAEGDSHDFAYFIEFGEIVLYRTHEGKRIDVEVRAAGSIIGELSVLRARPRAVSAAALSECRVFRIPAQQIQTRYARLDPLLQACVETSIDFNSHFERTLRIPDSGPVEVSPTLRNSEEFLKNLQIESDLINGLLRGDFTAEFQPIVRLSDGEIVGFETLLRWSHPTLGMIPPTSFIPLAEDMGAISSLTNFALEKACAFLAKIHDMAPDHEQIYGTVNVTSTDIDMPDFVDLLCRTLFKYELEPRHLRLEITESDQVSQSDQSRVNLARIKSLGFGVVIDDFGAGYSNFGYFKQLPLTMLKIDRSLCSDVSTNRISECIVRQVIELGGELEIDIVAEGLETSTDIVSLRDLGCQYAQGFHFFEPMSEHHLLKLLLNGDRLAAI